MGSRQGSRRKLREGSGERLPVELMNRRLEPSFVYQQQQHAQRGPHTPPDISTAKPLILLVLLRILQNQISKVLKSIKINNF